MEAKVVILSLLVGLLVEAVAVMDEKLELTERVGVDIWVEEAETRVPSETAVSLGSLEMKLEASATKLVEDEEETAASHAAAALCERFPFTSGKLDSVDMIGDHLETSISLLASQTVSKMIMEGDTVVMGVTLEVSEKV